ncbi:MAG: hypothetical protein A2035_02860 [Nitrospirae bacterium GWA2_42_11]|nr:MAG: hypothetical protein A2035_02860 [Nitrospirae bacterium GWA2_42_11]
MPTVQKSLRVPEEINKKIEELARISGKDFTTVANELLEEAIKAHQCPGIVFTEGTSGKRARMGGSGIEVWEVIAAYKSVGEDFKRLSKSYHWLTEQQLKSAIGYYILYRKEIDAIIAENERFTPDTVRKKYPFLIAGKR